MTLMHIAPLFRAMLCMATVGLFLLYAVDMILAFRQGNRRELLLSGLLFFCTYVLHQTVRTVIHFCVYGKQERLAQLCGGVSAWLCLAGILVLLGLGAAILHRLIVWSRSHVSQTSIKESLDNLPSGLAFYEDDGSCLLVNHTMNHISVCLTGQAVLDGRVLEAAARSGDMLVDADGRKYQMTHRLLAYGNGSIHELVADDVTELHKKTRELSESNAELAEMVRKMRQYSLNIDESVRKQEILQAKVQIHDEMNRLLLATGNAASGAVAREDLQKILFTWQNNALLLCKEADHEPTGNTEQDLQTLASIIGMTIEWDGRLQTRETRVLQLFELATREALSNAAKHAKAGHLYVRLRESKDRLAVTYTNDGIAPGGEIRPAGGLKDLCRVLENAGGSVSVSAEPAFALTITIPLGGKTNAV